LGGVIPKDKFPHMDVTCILMGGGGIYVKNKSLSGIFVKKKKIPEPGIFQQKKNSWVPGFTGKMFRALASDQNTDLHPNGGR
jgi:hypothetical protein